MKDLTTLGLRALISLTIIAALGTVAPGLAAPPESDLPAASACFGLEGAWEGPGTLQGRDVRALAVWGEDTEGHCALRFEVSGAQEGAEPFFVADALYRTEGERVLGAWSDPREGISLVDGTASETGLRVAWGPSPRGRSLYERQGDAVTIRDCVEIGDGCRVFAEYRLGQQIEPEPATVSPEASAGPEEDRQMKRVTGVGGIFFKSEDPDALRAWYRDHLGIESEEWGGFPFQWRERGAPDEVGYTVWSPFPASTKYFAPAETPFMVNYRVADLGGLIEALRAEGVEVLGEIEEHPNGKFAWVLDPEGRKIELWEPVPSAEDPFL